MKKSPLFDKSKIVIYTDGGSRGNPGPAAIGVVMSDKEYGEHLGEKTNNQAEYEAVIFALKKVKQLIGKAKAKESEVEIRLDSELVSRQLNGRYKILEEDLQPLFIQIWNLKLDFKKVDFLHVPREENRKADKVVNDVLDGEA
jgi:ribonuclease HI